MQSGVQYDLPRRHNIMTVLKSTLERFWARPRVTGALVASLALLPASYSNAAQPTFPSPEAAARELYASLQNNNLPELRQILGADGQLVMVGDTAADRLDRQRVVQKYQEMHRLARQPDGTMVLYIGAENWPFPLPLVAKDGAWRFDSAMGAKEIVFRQIGENEMTAIDVCHELAHGQGPAGGDRPIAYHGYTFRILSKAPDGFSAIAYPSTYRSSGVMTFVIDGKDVVYEKDLGPGSARTAQSIKQFTSDSTWVPAEADPDR
jgi:hypothetical protein